MSTESKTCAFCYSSKATHKGHRTDACPLCGEPKDVRASLCYACRKGRAIQTYVPKGHPRQGTAHFNPEDIDREWALAFSGLFVGEGSVQIVRLGKGLPKPVVGIHMRQDEEPLLRDIQSRLGGWITMRGESKPSMEGYISRPQIQWNCSGFQMVKPVLELLLMCPLPAKKVKEFHFVLDYINWRSTIGTFPSQEEKLVAERYLRSLRDMRIFKVQG